MNAEETLVNLFESASKAARKAEQELDIAIAMEKKAYQKVLDAQEYEAELGELLIFWRENNGV